MAAGYIPKELAGADWTRLSGGGLHILRTEGNLVAVLRSQCRSSRCSILPGGVCDLCDIFDYLVRNESCRVIYSFEDEFVKYGLFEFMFSFFTFM